MPEGDTVWRACKRLDQALAGQELVRTDFRVPTLATTDLSGRTVLEVIARGKHLLMRVSGGVTVHSHFRMDGSWHLYRPGERWRGGPDHQVRAVLETSSWIAVGYRLPVLELVATDAEESVVGHLGPDLLSPSFDRAEAITNVESEPDRTISEALLDQRNLAGADGGLNTVGVSRREIGEALLDQRCIAGIGTVYRAETLFLAGVSPFRPVSEVPDLGRVVDLARRLMLANLENPLQVTTGVARRGRQHWVYRRAGQPCRRCGTVIRSAMQGPSSDRERVVYWCPSCQPD